MPPDELFTTADMRPVLVSQDVADQMATIVALRMYRPPTVALAAEYPFSRILRREVRMREVRPGGVCIV
jgi:hypothetical protein